MPVVWLGQCAGGNGNMIQINRGFRGGNRGRTSWQEIVVLAHAIQGSYGVYGLVRLPAGVWQMAVAAALGTVVVVVVVVGDDAVAIVTATDWVAFGATVTRLEYGW